MSNEVGEEAWEALQWVILPKGSVLVHRLLSNREGAYAAQVSPMSRAHIW